MYIIKLKNGNETTQLQSTRSCSLQKQRLKKKTEYSDSFQKLMNKVLNKIYHNNNFSSKRKSNFLSYSTNQRQQMKSFQKTFKPFSPRRCSTTFQDMSIYATPKRSLANISRSQSQNNKYTDPKNKSSISFVNNKQFLKGIKLKKQQNKFFQEVNTRKPVFLPTQTTYFQTRYSNRSDKHIELPSFITDRGHQNKDYMNKQVLGIQKLAPAKSSQVVSKIRIQKQNKKQKYFTKKFFSKKQIQQSQDQQENITFEPWNSEQVSVDHSKIYFKQERRY